MLEKFNIYDLVANLIPGALFFWSLDVLAHIAGYTLPHAFKNSTGWEFKEASMLIVLCYVAGLLWQTLSVLTVEKFLKRRWGGGFLSAMQLMPPETDKEKKKKDLSLPPAKQAQIRARATKEFKIETEVVIPPGTTDKDALGMRIGKNQEIFFLCFSYVFNLSPRPQVFNSQYCQFRCLTAIFGFFTLAAPVAIVFHPVCSYCTGVAQTGKLVVFSVLYLVATLLFYFSCKSYAQSFVGSVFDLFIGGVAKLPEKE